MHFEDRVLFKPLGRCYVCGGEGWEAGEGRGRGWAVAEMHNNMHNNMNDWVRRIHVTSKYF